MSRHLFLARVLLVVRCTYNERTLLDWWIRERNDLEWSGRVNIGRPNMTKSAYISSVTRRSGDNAGITPAKEKEGEMIENAIDDCIVSQH